MSEWLRRQTRNLLGFACAGSNPAVDGLFYFFSFIIFFSFQFSNPNIKIIKKKKYMKGNLVHFGF